LAAVQVDAGALAAAGGGWDGDVDGAVEGFQELPEDGGGAVAEDGALAAGKHRGHKATVEAQSPMADGVDPAMDAMELSSIHAIADSASAQASAFKLLPRRRPMLPRRNSRHFKIGRVAFLTHVGT
jgi:hypothetical protein